MVRINVMLPEETLETLDRLAKRGDRSRLIDKAVRHYADTRTAEGLREQLRQASVRDRDLDLETTDEWSAVDHESWQHHEEELAGSPAGTVRSAAKSTSRRSTRP